MKLGILSPWYFSVWKFGGILSKKAQFKSRVTYVLWMQSLKCFWYGNSWWRSWDSLDGYIMTTKQMTRCHILLFCVVEITRTIIPKDTFRELFVDNPQTLYQLPDVWSKHWTDDLTWNGINSRLSFPMNVYLGGLPLLLVSVEKRHVIE